MEDYIRYFAPKEAFFSKEQLLRIANIFDNAGQVVFGIMVLSPLVTGFDTVGIWMVVLGAIGTLFCWSLSVYISRNIS